MKQRFICFSLCLALCLSVQKSLAQPGKLIQTFLNPGQNLPGPGPENFFGFAVASVGNNVLISAPFGDGGSSGVGIVYMFNGNTGTQIQTFLSPNPEVSYQFGRSVAGVGNNALIGVPLDDKDAGTAYLFNGDTGALIHTFNNPAQGLSF
jgi:hypothetical protein